MAYDEYLADRIRALVGGERGLTEQKMFGGLAFLIDGNMSVSASGQGGLLLRVDPEQTDELLAEPGLYRHLWSAQSGSAEHAESSPAAVAPDYAAEPMAA